MRAKSGQLLRVGVLCILGVAGCSRDVDLEGIATDEMGLGDEIGRLAKKTGRSCNSARTKNRRTKVSS